MSSKKIRGRIVHHCRDEHGEIIVTDDGMARSLYFGDVQQSTIRPDRPEVLLDDYSQAMMSVLAFRPHPGSVLIIGLGGCALVHFFLHAYPECTVHVVEIRQRVIDAAHEFFLLPREGAHLRVFHAAGQDFVAGQEGLAAYDLILSDAFDEGGPAVDLLRHDFLDSCRARLAGDGIFVMNLWNRPQDEFPSLYAHLQEAFGGTALKLVPGENFGNALVFWSADPGMFQDPPSYRPMARRLQRDHGINAPKYLMCLYRQNLTTA